jgi:arsenate reductase
VALLANTLATGAALVALLLTFAPISGAHLNPVVTIAAAWERGLPWPDVPGYLAAQVGGALAGTAIADLMFEEPVFSLARHARSGPAQWLSEFVATFGLVAVFNALAEPSRAQAVSAGTDPGEQVHPAVVTAMLEVGVEPSGIRPRKLTDELTHEASLLVTMGCGAACPHVPGVRQENWALEDPKGRSVEEVRAIRDEIRQRMERLSHQWQRAIP